MKKIELTQGKHALVDDADYDHLMQWKWSAAMMAHNHRATRRHENSNETIYMHREIMGFKKGDTRHVDHINHNPLDNRRINLRCCTRSQNLMNSIKRKGTSSVYKGVSWFNASRKWKAYIKINTKQKYLGLFETETAAAVAYDTEAKELFGEYALLNFQEAS